MKKVLIIGGTYFAGRVFAIIANQKGYELSFINRGTFSMGHMENTKEYKCERHDIGALKNIPYDEYDAIVDFCAYNPGDCKILLENLNIKTEKYILLTTADVYDMTTREPKTEESALQSHPLGGPASEYMWNKRNIEYEARQICDEKRIKLILIRPAFIYGPYNYAPRESFYVETICKGLPVPAPTDANSKWNFVYVKDVAEALCACVEKDIQSGEAFNLSNDEETITYESFLQYLKEASDISFTTRPVSVNQVIQENIPVPFPLFAEENELFIGQKAKEVLGIAYTPLNDGLKKAFNAFKGIYMNRT